MTVEDVRIRNKKAVLREASRLFSEEGVEHTTVGQVAARAGVTRRSVMNYFDSKTALIMAVQDEYVRDSSIKLERFFSSEEYINLSGLDQFVGILRYVLEALREQYKMANNLSEMTSILLRDPELDNRGELSVALRLISGQLEPAYRKGLSDGSISGDCVVRPEDITLITLLLRGLYRQLAYVMARESEEDLAFARDMIETFLSMARRTLQTVTPEQ